MTKADLLELAARCEAATGAKVLRFSRADVAGRAGYRWQSIQTEILCALWNNRETVARALRALAEEMPDV
jgi:hypothetical protein